MASRARLIDCIELINFQTFKGNYQIVFQLIRTNSADSDFHALVALLDKELLERYPEEQSFFDDFNKLDDTARVVVRYVNDIPVACGCFRPYPDGSAELKRMYTLNEQRGKGFAKEIIRELEQWIREEGFSRIILETGVKQPEAQKAYLQCGFTIIKNYGAYANIESSICMEKLL